MALAQGIPVILPLVTRSAEGGSAFVVTAADPSPRLSPPSSSALRMPSRSPEPGEQYRFHLDMGRCIGCKCCVVACNEQNGNPAAINWRRVGEIEGGWYPHTQRAYLSMSCNHCLDPTCLSGCPVDAYTKEPRTGIVLHSADACIGCQYCTWNCSYGVPQYNPERGVVGKCDMCYGRLETGGAPACVAACPSGAIQIEIVKVEDWRAAIVQPTPALGLPSGDRSLSTTRVTVPRSLPPNARPTDLVRLTLGEPHWPLVFMTVLTQLSVGAFVAIWLIQLISGFDRLGVAAVTALAIGAVALVASTAHLGRPAYAYRALKMWKRSWLSREVLLFAMFSAVASVYAAALWWQWQWAAGVGALTVALGCAGVTASACIYRVPSRPAWDTPFTLVQFNLTAATLGPLFAATLVGNGSTTLLVVVTAMMAGGELVVLALRFFRCSTSDAVELQASARLLASKLSRQLLLRGALLLIGAIALPLFARHVVVLALACACALAGEILGRYLFFVSAVPKHMTAAYIGGEAA